MRISDWSSDVCSSDLIYDSCAPTSADPLCFQPGANISRWGYYQNVSRAEAQGIEVQAAAQLIDGLSIDGNYSWTLAEDRSPGSENLGKWLPRRPRNTANGSISYAWRFGLTTGVAIRWSGQDRKSVVEGKRVSGRVDH